MRKIKILHAADLHLDSPFEGLPAGKASIRRGEQRALLSRMAELAVLEQVDAVLLSGDLLDSGNTYFETGEELIRSLGRIAAPVFIAPGNHDYYTPKSPYARLKLPENVHVFTESSMQVFELPGLPARIYGAAFTGSRSGALLMDFHAPRTEGVYNLLCLHGEVGVRESVYNPVSEAELSQSGIDYAAFGHVHKASGLRKAGDTWYAWPGCPEGRGFDETGEKTVNIVELEGETCTLRQVCVSSRRYELLRVDVTDSDALLAIHGQLPDDTVRDVYRIVLTGEAEETPDLKKLQSSLSELFFELQLRDETRLRRDVWDSAGEDTLRGLFLAKLRARYDKTKDEAERVRIEQAARWGLAALDNAEEVARHEDP